MPSKDLLLFSGNAHPQLSRDIAEELDMRLLDATVDRFPDKETRVKINANVREKDVFVLQPTGPSANQNIMETLIMVDALRRASAKRITAVTPYFGYARQDRKEQSRVPITAKLVANLFVASGVDRIVAVDLHSHQIQGFTDIPLDHLYARKTITDHLRGIVDKPVMVAPDVGAGKMVRGYAEELNAHFAIVDKNRIDSKHTEIVAMLGKRVKKRDVVIVDDMTSTGGSLISAANALKDKGANSVIAVVTHGVLNKKAISRIEDSPALDMLYTTDTLPRVRKSHKIERITIAPLLARAILNIHRGESVTELF